MSSLYMYKFSVNVQLFHYSQRTNIALHTPKKETSQFTAIWSQAISSSPTRKKIIKRKELNKPRPSVGVRERTSFKKYVEWRNDNNEENEFDFSSRLSG